MHSALRIPELRGRIVEYLVDNYTEWAYSHYLRDLNALARTCKAFSEPCLDELWRCQDGLVNLVKTMPGDLWDYVDEDYEPEYEVKLVRPPCPSDWDRASYYAKKIKYLEVASFFGLNEDALTALYASSPTPPLLPSLACLKIEFYRGNVQSLLEPLTFLLNPKITRFIGNFIYPPLDDLHTARSQIYVFLFWLFVTCKHLRCVNLEHMSFFRIARLRADKSRALKYLEQLPVLVSLTLDCRGDVFSAFSGSILSSAQGGFPSLKDLKVHASTWMDALTVVKRIKCPLSSLRVAAYERVSDQSHSHPRVHLIEKLLQEVATYAPLTSLEIIERTFDGRSVQFPSVSLEPLLSLHKIETLVIKLPRILEDSWLERLPLSFPSLVSLSLGWAPPRTPADYFPSMALQDIIPIVIHCKKLQDLRISARCDPFDFRSKLSGDISDSPICSVSLFGSPIGEPNEVSPCLMAMFPNARTIQGEMDIQYHPNHLQYKVRWEDLNKRLPSSSRVTKF